MTSGIIIPYLLGVGGGCTYIGNFFPPNEYHLTNSYTYDVAQGDIVRYRKRILTTCKVLNTNSTANTYSPSYSLNSSYRLVRSGHSGENWSYACYSATAASDFTDYEVDHVVITISRNTSLIKWAFDYKDY